MLPTAVLVFLTIYLSWYLLFLQVVFIDEIDAIAPSREGQQQLSVSGMSSRLISTLATELDYNEGEPKWRLWMWLTTSDLIPESVVGHEVIVIAATNRVSALDDSLRRPGRFDQEIEVGVPSPSERLEILKAILSTVVHVLDEMMVICSISYVLGDLHPTPLAEV